MQILTAFKRALANGGESTGKSGTCQPQAVRERVLANRSQRIREIHGVKTLRISEGKIANACDRAERAGVATELTIVKCANTYRLERGVHVNDRLFSTKMPQIEPFCLIPAVLSLLFVFFL